MKERIDTKAFLDDCKVIDAIYALQPNASGATIIVWLNQNRPKPWWKFWGWLAGEVWVCLARLERMGLIASGWERRAGVYAPRRRLYTVGPR